MGGSDAPGLFLAAAALFALPAAGLAAWGTPWCAVPIAAAAVSLLTVPLAWYHCHGGCWEGSRGGAECPHCGGTNRIRLWSL